MAEKATAARDRPRARPTRIRQGDVVKKQGKILKGNREEAVLIAERAHEWLDRLERSHDPNDRAEFMAWLKESPLHVREVLFATTFDAALAHVLDPDHKQDIEALASQTNVVPLSNGAGQDMGSATVKPRTMRDKRLGWRSLVALAAAACLAIAIAVDWSYPTQPTEQFGTAIGEQRSIGLSDGSIVHMNTRSRVRVAFSDTARDVYLLDGQAIFKVKHDAARPFRVHVDTAVVQAIGTQFDVHRLKDRTNVAVIEGVVQIISGTEGKLDAETLSKLPENTKVPAGESVVIVADGKLTPHAEISPQDAGAWQQRRLIFRNHTLAEIADEFNRYNHTQLRVEGETLRTMRFTRLVLDAGDPQTLLDYLARERPIVTERVGDELVIRIQPNFAQTKPAK
jgi:transmembrane sensor